MVDTFTCTQPSATPETTSNTHTARLPGQGAAGFWLATRAGPPHACWPWRFIRHTPSSPSVASCSSGWSHVGSSSPYFSHLLAPETVRHIRSGLASRRKTPSNSRERSACGPRFLAHDITARRLRPEVPAAPHAFGARGARARGSPLDRVVVPEQLAHPLAALLHRLLVPRILHTPTLKDRQGQTMNSPNKGAEDGS